MNLYMRSGNIPSKKDMMQNIKEYLTKSENGKKMIVYLVPLRSFLMETK